MMRHGTDKPTVAVLTAVGEQWPGLEPLDGEARLCPAATRDALDAALTEADVLLVTDFRTTLLRQAWPAARHLKWIHATSAGVDVLLFPELIDSDVTLTNARGIFDGAISEYVLGLILAFAKDLAGTFALQHDQTWRHRETERISGRHVMVVGAGSIGRAIARTVRAAGMHVSGVATHERRGDPDFDRVDAAEALPDALSTADFVVVAAPLTAATHGLFDTGAFGSMRRDARLINIGRGAIVNTGALIDALEKGRIAGAALDVFEDEPLPPDSPLWSLPNVIVSPHMAGDFIGWREALSAQFVENFRRWRSGGELFNRVDKRRYR